MRAQKDLAPHFQRRDLRPELTYHESGSHPWEVYNPAGHFGLSARSYDYGWDCNQYGRERGERHKEAWQSFAIRRAALQSFPSEVFNHCEGNIINIRADFSRFSVFQTAHRNFSLLSLMSR